MSHALSHSHSQLLGLQMNPLSHTPLSINSLHLHHLHLFIFRRCLLLQTVASNLHSHLNVSCHSLTFKFFIIVRTQVFAYGLLILLQLPLHLLILILKG